MSDQTIVKIVHDIHNARSNNKVFKISASDLTEKQLTELQTMGFVLRYDSGINFDVSGDEDASVLDALAFYWLR